MPGVPPTGGEIVQAAKGIHRFYSASELANLARDAGFRDDAHPSTRASELAVAVAIALAESGGDRLAQGPPIEHGTAKGLWQIYPSGQEMFDPATNANAAWDKYVGAGHRFTPWSTYNSRAYLVKLPAAEIAVRQTHRDRPAFTGGGTGVVHDIIAFTGNIGHDVAAFFAWITSGQTWIRLGEVLGGAVLFLVAIWLLFSHTSIGKDVRSVATRGAA